MLNTDKKSKGASIDATLHITLSQLAALPAFRKLTQTTKKPVAKTKIPVGFKSCYREFKRLKVSGSFCLWKALYYARTTKPKCFVTGDGDVYANQEGMDLLKIVQSYVTANTTKKSTHVNSITSRLTAVQIELNKIKRDWLASSM